ncbi:hypothetical protein AAAC51_39280 [Priestia megaterium]
MLKEEPYADGNPNFWIETPAIQHPKTITELVFWDSSLILLLSKDKEMSKNLRNKFKKWKDLNEYNKNRTLNIPIGELNMNSKQLFLRELHNIIKEYSEIGDN